MTQFAKTIKLYKFCIIRKPYFLKAITEFGCKYLHILPLKTVNFNILVLNTLWINSPYLPFNQERNPQYDDLHFAPYLYLRKRQCINIINDIQLIQHKPSSCLPK